MNGFLNSEQLDAYLQLAQMSRPDRRKRLYARTVNGEDGFLPPGLLFGLLFAWYLDNRFAPYFDTPSFSFGPAGGNHHSIDEYVEISSLMRVTKTLAVFAAEWCGLTD